MRDFKKIKAWQLADDLAVAVYQVTERRFPRSERFGLTAQIQRAALSVASNIVEGSKRRQHRDFLRFLDIANGSLAEVEYQLHLAKRLGYLGDEDYGKISALREEVARTLHGLIAVVEKEVDPHG